MGFDIVDVAGGEARGCVRTAQHGHLRRWVGRHQTVGMAVLIDCRTAHDGDHVVAVANRVGQPFQHHDARTLTAHITVGGCVERVALSALRHRLRGIEAAGDRGRQHHIDASGQRECRFARTQTLACEMDGHERRRACGVDGDRRTAEVVVVRQAVGDDRRRSTGPRPRVDLTQVARRQRTVFTGTRTRENTGLRVTQRAGRDAGVVERLLGDLEQQTLLRVHLVGLAG
ncbi:Uncharacterised protein [Mycobacteroides abscessus subsp. abscessus]|nr:Uncharacterised protein [Mycobacteroides abscessus subsp. abscessus]